MAGIGGVVVPEGLPPEHLSNAGCVNATPRYPNKHTLLPNAQVRVETQHLLLADHHPGRGSSQDDDGGLAHAGAGGEVVVFVEEPRRYIAPSSSAAAGNVSSSSRSSGGDGGSMQAQPQHQAAGLGWVGRAANRLGLTTGKKLKDDEAAAGCSRHAPAADGGGPSAWGQLRR